MSSPAMQSVLAFVPKALAASQAGTWEYDVDADRLCGDALTANLFGLPSSEAVAGLPMAQFLHDVHPDDEVRAQPLRALMRQRGGTFVFELRIGSGAGHRWGLIRGTYARDETGAMHGRGIVIDVTASKLDGNLEERSLFVAEMPEPSSALDEAAEHAIAARKAIDRVEQPDGSALRKAVDALLWAIGRALAQRG